MSEREIVCADLGAALDELRSQGFRIDIIYPADDPHTARLSRGGERVRVTSRPEASPIWAEMPPFIPEFVLTRADGAPAQGRAGMLYRDLIPGRLGGRYVASHITTPGGGPVDDWVHFHHVALQLIFVARGWVRVVYEDQGEPFVMEAGDLVLQPPGIRHRVLESSAGLEVVEIGCPALHETHADHEMELPNAVLDKSRLFSGQRFLHHVARAAPWRALYGGEAQETALKLASGGLAEARTIRRGAVSEIAFPIHDGELAFGFVIEGEARLEMAGTYDLGSGDAFVIPPGREWRLDRMTLDFRLLQVLASVPGPGA